MTTYEEMQYRNTAQKLIREGRFKVAEPLNTKQLLQRAYRSGYRKNWVKSDSHKQPSTA